MNRSIAIPFIAVALLGFGCAHDPSKELEAARRTYAEAEDGPAGELAKVEVSEAKKALERAERAHDRKAGSAEEVDLSYVALRRADYAIAFANYLAYAKQTARAKAEHVKSLESQTDQAENQLDELDAKMGRPTPTDPSKSARLATPRDPTAPTVKRKAPSPIESPR